METPKEDPFTPDLADPMFAPKPVIPTPSPEEEALRNKEGIRKWFTKPWGAALASVICNSILGLGFIFVGANHFEDYGMALFVIAPITLGFLSSLFYHMYQTRKLWHSILIAIITVVVLGLASIAFLMEGAICVLMASPILMLGAIIGSVAGYFLAKSVRKKYKLMLIGLIAPFLAMGVEDQLDLQPTPQTTISSVIVEAPPQVVWEVLEEPLDFGLQEHALFKAGVTYPHTMQLQDQDGQAALHVVHSRGEIDLPIVSMKDSKEFIFQIEETPEPMKELSPTGEFDAPHLHGYFNAYLGGFTLEDLGNGQTRLSGATRYSYKIYPANYWQHWTTYLIDQMHLYVLNAVKNKTENQHANQ